MSLPKWIVYHCSCIMVDGDFYFTMILIFHSDIYVWDN